MAPFQDGKEFFIVFRNIRKLMVFCQFTETK